MAPGLARTAVSGVLWQGSAFLLGRGFTLVTTIVLARLLSPADFGLVALALVFVTFADYVADLGIAQALVYLERDERTEAAAFVLCLLAGAALCAAGVALAPAVAELFGRPDAAPLVRVLSLSLLIGALRQVPLALLRRDLAFRKIVVTEVVRATTQGVVSIALALAGLEAWAIAWGFMAGAVAWCAAAWLAADYRPPRLAGALSGPGTRRLLAYGAPAAAQALLAGLIFDIDYVIVGSVLGAEALGAYTVAFRLPQVLVIGAFAVLSSVAFPMFSRVRGDRARLRAGYLAGVRLQAAYGAAAGVGLCMVAPMLVSVLFGPGWEAAVVPLQALSLYAAARGLGVGAVDVYKGIGRPGLAAAISLLRLAILVPALLVAAGEGLDAVAWTQAALALVFAAGMQAVAARVVGIRGAELAVALRPALAVAAGIALGAGAVRAGLPGPEGLRLAAAVAAGAATGLAALWAADAGFLRETRALLTRRGDTAVAAPT